ncbi:MAG: hypothetical protein EXR39_11035 [Betaproteobacteria bacterium]|nr:hypothetical protein [Betaproteobacteria bacterium]
MAGVLKVVVSIGALAIMRSGRCALRHAADQYGYQTIDGKPRRRIRFTQPTRHVHDEFVLNGTIDHAEQVLRHGSLPN